MGCAVLEGSWVALWELPGGFSAFFCSPGEQPTVRFHESHLQHLTSQEQCKGLQVPFRGYTAVECRV